jgi:hypothetical protein
MMAHFCIVNHLLANFFCVHTYIHEKYITIDMTCTISFVLNFEKQHFKYVQQKRKSIKIKLLTNKFERRYLSDTYLKRIIIVLITLRQKYIAFFFEQKQIIKINIFNMISILESFWLNCSFFQLHLADVNLAFDIMP